MSRIDIILGSGSPRRKEMMKALGFKFTVVAPNIEEVSEKQIPVEICEDISRKKFDFLVKNGVDKSSIGITGDTIVCVGNTVFGKAEDHQSAKETLLYLSGREHEVISSLTIGDLRGDFVLTSSEITRVKFRSLSSNEVDIYLNYASYKDKAGSYGIQDPHCFFVSQITGSLSNVIGLPIELLKLQLTQILRSKYKKNDWQDLL